MTAIIKHHVGLFQTDISRLIRCFYDQLFQLKPMSPKCGPNILKNFSKLSELHLIFLRLNHLFLDANQLELLYLGSKILRTYAAPKTVKNKLSM